VGGVVGAVSGLSAGLAGALIAGLLAAGWLSFFVAGGAANVPAHWFYIPIVFAAARFGLPGAIVTALVSGLVIGPLMPADIAMGVPQPLSEEIVRTFYFLVIGALMASVIWRLEESLSKEAEVARREVELAAHKAAVIATVSHEFRTPLSVLLGSSKMLLERGGWPELERTLIEGISGSARRLNDLVTTVLVVSEGPLAAEELVLTTTPLWQVVSAVATGTRPRETPRLHVDVGNVLVWTNPPALEALLRQLVDNALKFSPLSSPVDIIVRDASEHHIELVVGDRGPGIDERWLPMVFQAFTQLDGSDTRSSGGLGIGLFVAQRLAEYLGVRLQLRPRLGGGTEACVTLRRVSARGPEAGRRPETPVHPGR
jgi:two-component system, OmpR family, sensor histidine kinase KdpD